jgi:hypothetical protein
MAQIKNMDEANARGERHVAEGMTKDEAKALLIGFNFNVNAVLGAVLYQSFEVDTETGEISIEALTPQNDINLPSGASHIVFKSGFASVNFATGESEMTVSAPLRIATDAATQAVSLKPAAAPAIDGTHFILLSIDFVQSVNNADYSLKNNLFNVLAIVTVD